MQTLQAALGKVKDAWLFGAMVLYYLVITLLIPTPWFPTPPGYSFEMSLVLGGLPLFIGLIRNSPAAITTGFIMAAIGPYNQTAVILSFALGIYLGIRTLWRYRGRFSELYKSVFVLKGFYFLLGIVAYSLIIWLIRIGDSTDWWSFLALASSLMTIPFAAYSLGYLSWDRAEVKNTLHNLFLVGLALAAVAFAYPLITGQFEQYTQALFVVFKSFRVVVDPPFDMPWVDPDYNRVSFSSSHYFAVWMLIFAFGSIVAALITKKRTVLVVAAVLGLYCFALGENAHILPGAIAGTAAVILLVFLKKRTLRLQSMVVLGFGIAGIAAVIYVLYFNGGIYSLSEKAAMYRIAGERIVHHPGRYLLGDGPASYASRAANKRLNHAGVEIEYSFPFGIPDFSQVAFEDAVVEAKTREGGSTMKRTLSGIIGIVMEWGILGTVLLLLVFHMLLRTAVATWGKGTTIESRVIGAATMFGFLVLTVSLSVRTYYEYAELSALVAVLFMLSAVVRELDKKDLQTV